MYFFFFNDTATTEIYTLSLHDALPISMLYYKGQCEYYSAMNKSGLTLNPSEFIFCSDPNIDTYINKNNLTNSDRKSTRLNSSHANISYAVFCLKKKKITNT